MTLSPACWSLARSISLLELLGSGEKSRSVSGSSLGLPLRPPRPREEPPPLGGGTGALMGILGMIGGSGGPSRVMTSLGPGLPDTPLTPGDGPLKLNIVTFKYILENVLKRYLPKPVHSRILSVDHCLGFGHFLKIEK